jgi:hypothetical protein
MRSPVFLPHLVITFPILSNFFSGSTAEKMAWKKAARGLVRLPQPIYNESPPTSIEYIALLGAYYIRLGFDAV